MFVAKINVMLKESVLDPQGQTVLKASQDLGILETKDIRVGKFIEVTLDCKDKETAHKKAEELCEKILANQVIETYSIQIQTV